MKKVLFVATVTNHINAFHIPYLKLFKDRGYEVHVASKGNERIDYCDKHFNLPFERSPFNINNLKVYFKLKKLIKENCYEIIHCHTPVGSVLTRFAAKKVQRKHITKVIYTAHGFHFYKGTPLINWILFYPVEMYLSKYTDTLITINKEDFERANKKFGRRCKDIQYIPGVGVNEKKYNTKISKVEKEKIKNEIGIKNDDIVLIQIGELNKNKNQIMSINAMKQLIKSNKNIHLLLIGDGPLKENYNKMIKDYNLTNNIHLLGYRNDIPKLLQISNILLSLSYREGLPVNVMEAMFCKIPIIATNCRGNKDLIDIENLIEINNCNDLVKKINKIIKDGISKKEYNIDDKSLNNVTNKIKDIYFQKKKILHILASNSCSGAENVVCNIIKNMSESYDMIYCSPKGPIEKKLQDENIKYILVNKLSIINIRRVVKEFKPDIIHAHDYRASLIASFFCKGHKIISHIHSNNFLMNNKNFKSCIFNIISKRIDRFIWVSDSSLNNYYFKDKLINKSMVLYNVVNKEDIINKTNKYICNKHYDLIYLGRLTYQKNPQRLIQIMKELIKIKSDISLAIIGDGEDRVKVENLITEYNLSNNITLYGYQENPYPILKNSKILIMTSVYEGTPMAALEAQTLGKPVIATRVDGLVKIIKNDYNGYLSDDNNELIEKIICYLNDETYKTICKNVNNEFSVINNEKNYYNEIKKYYIL